MKLEKVSDRMTPSIERIKKSFNTVAPEAHKFFVGVTPKQSGNARSKTRLVREEIRAEYGYAKVLDRGYSKQAPQGMSRPTVAYIRRLLNNIVRK